MNVREGFDTSFTFRLSNPSTFCSRMDDVFTSCRSRGGDGFAFVVQNDEAISVGSGGMELGYGGLQNALAVEFDTWYNPEQLDVYENHISVHMSDGSAVAAVQASHTFALGATSNLPDLTDGDHSVRIVYDPVLDEDMCVVNRRWLVGCVCRDTVDGDGVWPTEFARLPFAYMRRCRSLLLPVVHSFV